MVRKENGSINWVKIGVIIAFISALIVIAGFVWSGSKTDTMAKEAYKFASDNAALPSEVKENTKDIEENKKEIIEYRKSLIEITKFQTRQEALTDRLDEISKRIE